MCELRKEFMTDNIHIKCKYVDYEVMEAKPYLKDKKNVI